MPFSSSDHLMHVRRCLLDFGFAIVVVNVFVVLMCPDLTTAESSVKVWHLHFSPPLPSPPPEA